MLWDFRIILHDYRSIQVGFPDDGYGALPGHLVFALTPGTRSQSAFFPLTLLRI